MRDIRIFQDTELTIGAPFQLNERSSHHLAQVLKLAEGDEVILFNGDGNDYLGRIQSITKKKVMFEIQERIENRNESSLKIHLYQGLSKGDRMDFAIQKSVELGVTSITPLICERTVVRTSSERGEKKLQHWKNIIISACEQSGRAILPVLNPLQSFEDCLQAANTGQSILLHPEQDNPISKAELSDGEIQLFIGPEGGFSEREVQLATTAGIKTVAMGKRVLRTETAPVAAIAVLQSRLGDY